ncbi:unnamed protein product [Symbiodinium natans]|uniref:PA domain-containing protein n=1 Tax=Symbiodinium natans TaxID=878477 RepID=A0A812P5W3_9DINO|nr:unnamed protein product [Symbiodinium natans]
MTGSDDAAQARLVEASQLAESGDLKAAQQMLKEAVAAKLIPSPLQRQVLAWWSAGEYDVLQSANKAGQAPKREPAEPKPDDMEAQVVRLMKEKQWSRKEACQYIDEGGLDMEAMRAEMNNPMDEAFEKLKQQGPPQWFVEAMTLHIEDTKPFIFHVLMTVRLNENGFVSCAALESATSYTPSISQMKTGTGLDGYDSASATANSYYNLVVAVLSPATLYDLFCYAEDSVVNGFTLSQIAATKQVVATATGGDYVAPVFSYVPPNYVVESTAVTVYVQLNEDGTVWCVAKEDSGSGTTTPTSAEILLNANVDSWATTTVQAAMSYQSSMRLAGLTEGTTYELYCFAQDTAGNYMDGTPAYASDVSKITATRLAFQTLAVFIPSTLIVTSPGPVQYAVKPAAWNNVLPACTADPRRGQRCERDAESWKKAPEYLSHKLISLDSHPSDGCFGYLPPAVPGGGPFVLLLRRGKCAFARKARRARDAGYDALLVVDQQPVQYLSALPDMMADSNDNPGIPGWILSKADGSALLATVSSHTAGYVTLDITDVYRTPSLGIYQSDVYGQRVYMKQ